MTTIQETYENDIKKYEQEIQRTTDPNFLDDLDEEIKELEELINITNSMTEDFEQDLEFLNILLRKQRRALLDQLEETGQYYCIGAGDGNWDNSFDNLEDLMNFIAQMTDEYEKDESIADGSFYVIPPHTSFEDKMLVALDQYSEERGA